MMNLERAAMKGQLADFESQKKRLILRAEASAGRIRTILNTALTPVEDQEIAEADQLMDDLVSIHGEIAGLNGRIIRIRYELGE